MSQLDIGADAPDFTAPATVTGTFTLSAHRGKAVVLFFYPRDNTAGCTTENQNFRDLLADFTEAGAVVVGASRDTLRSHEGFAAKHELPYPLVADPEETVCNLYGVMKQKMMYGKQVRGIERSTFLIDAEGRIHQVWRGVKVPGHAQAVLDAVRALR